jgi:hypothetical protein
MTLIRLGDAVAQVSDLLRTRTPASGGAELPRQSYMDGPSVSVRVTDEWLASSLADVLTRREAVRDFSEELLLAGKVCEIVASALANENWVWPVERHGDADFRVLLAVRRVEGLAAGLYAVGREGRPIPLPKVRPPRHVWESFVDAPALLFICADPHQGTRAGNGVGYGSVLVRAGTLGYSIWLSAVSSGLGGCAYGRSCHEVTLAAKQLDCRLRHLFTVSVGIPASAPGAAG